MDKRLLERSGGNCISHIGETKIWLLNCVVDIPKNLQAVALHMITTSRLAFARNWKQKKNRPKIHDWLMKIKRDLQNGEANRPAKKTPRDSSRLESLWLRVGQKFATTCGRVLNFTVFLNGFVRDVCLIMYTLYYVYYFIVSHKCFKTAGILTKAILEFPYVNLKSGYLIPSQA